MPDIRPIRQSSGQITLVSVVTVKDFRGSRKVAHLMCSCGFKYSTGLSKWQNQPPDACQKCTIKRLKSKGYHGFSPRYKEFE